MIFVSGKYTYIYFFLSTIKNQVFEGDDGERFERNWLYWTGAHEKYANFILIMFNILYHHLLGARMLYRYLPRNAGLRRITLHKCRLS